MKEEQHSESTPPALDGVATTPINGSSPSPERTIASTYPHLHKLYSPSVEATIWAVAHRALSAPEPPDLYPEYTKPGGTEYVYRELDFWTSGFFPGCLYALLERRHKSSRGQGLAPSSVLTAQTTTTSKTGISQIPHTTQLEFACEWWTANLHRNGTLTGTHDLGFMVMPWAGPASSSSFPSSSPSHASLSAATLRAAASTLHARFDPAVGLIRSWDACRTGRYHFHEPEKEFLVIIDNMMNLDMLFHVAAATGNQQMWDDAVTHARTTQRTHVRADGSTVHLVVLNPVAAAAAAAAAAASATNGEGGAPGTPPVLEKRTNQGWRDDSCWTRGQAWAIAGFAETYGWTRLPEFLATARKCADHFLARVPEAGWGLVPWDFDAAEQQQQQQQQDAPQQPTDSSAALVAAYGMLLIYKGMVARGGSSGASSSEAEKYRDGALKLVSTVCGRQMNEGAVARPVEVEIETVERGAGTKQAQGTAFDLPGGVTIVNGATINNHEFAPRRWANHGLVYADYFFLLVGNLLLDMGIGAEILAAAAAAAESGSA